MDNTALDIVRELKDGDYEMFKYIGARLERSIFVAGRYIDNAKVKLAISEATYWRRLKKLEDIGIIRKYSKGHYEIDTRRWKVLAEKTNELSEIKW